MLLVVAMITTVAVAGLTGSVAADDEQENDFEQENDVDVDQKQWVKQSNFNYQKQAGSIAVGKYADSYATQKSAQANVNSQSAKVYASNYAEDVEQENED
jgi:hypothetical protein